VRAYALLTLPAERKITVQAERRLKVLQSLDTLGAGFQLAPTISTSGRRQSVGRRESGQSRRSATSSTADAGGGVASLKAGISAPVADQWSPQSPSACR